MLIFNSRSLAVAAHSPQPGYRDVLPGMLLVYLIVFVWEFLTMPHSRPGPPGHNGMFGSITLLAAGSFLFAGDGGPVSRFFLFGMGASFLFIMRFHAARLSGMWWYNRPPQEEVVFSLWIAFAFGLGILCWLAALARRAWTHQGQAEPPYGS